MQLLTHLFAGNAHRLGEDKPRDALGARRVREGATVRIVRRFSAPPQPSQRETRDVRRGAVLLDLVQFVYHGIQIRVVLT